MDARPVHMTLFALIVAVQHVEFSGKKWDKKVYRHHTGFPGGFREQLAKHVHGTVHVVVWCHCQMLVLRLSSPLLDG